MDPALVIVGGGSAGCVLANRLSAAGGNRVVLIEAGPDTPPGRVPDDILDTYPGRVLVNADRMWRRLRVRLAAAAGNAPDAAPPVFYEQARVMGGGSSVNGQVALRGAPADYDLWQAKGASGWNWSAVLPYFCKLERDLDFDGPGHGKDGPIPIRRVPRPDWDGFTEAIVQVLERQGVPFRPDMNGAFEEGFSPIPISNSGAGRVSTAVGYLDADVRRRPNLEIVAGTEALRLVLDGRRVVGVEVEGRGGRRVVAAAETVLAAGALHSPLLMMRSGLGPARHLAALGIEVAVDLPGLGLNLQEHPAVTVSAYLPPAARVKAAMRRHNCVYVRYSSAVDGCEPIDMVLNLVGKSAWHALGERLGTVQVWIAKPYSRGRVALARGRNGIEPDIRFELLSDRRDLRRAMDGVRRVAALLAEEPARRAALDPFPSSYSERAKKIGAVTPGNRAITAATAVLMDLSPAVRRHLIRAVITRGVALEDILADERALEAHVRRAATGVWHPCGTLRMGAAGDPLAVTDPAGCVRGVGALRVADASVMPDIPRANTNLPAIMVAERMADLILGAG